MRGRGELDALEACDRVAGRRGGAPVRVEEGDGVAQNAISMHTTTRIARVPAATTRAEDARNGLRDD